MRRRVVNIYLSNHQYNNIALNSTITMISSRTPTSYTLTKQQLLLLQDEKEIILLTENSSIWCAGTMTF